MPATNPSYSFSWPLAVPWILTCVFGAYGVWSTIRTRKNIIRLLVKRRNDAGRPHGRFLCVDLTNWGADLHDVSVRLMAKSKEGVDNGEGGKTEEVNLPFGPVGELPNPFKLGQSRRFSLGIEEPNRSAWGLENFDPKDVRVIVYSGVREVRMITAKTFKAELDKFAKPDPSLPPKPADKPSINVADFVNRRRY